MTTGSKGKTDIEKTKVKLCLADKMCRSLHELRCADLAVSLCYFHTPIPLQLAVVLCIIYSFIECVTWHLHITNKFLMNFFLSNSVWGTSSNYRAIPLFLLFTITFFFFSLISLLYFHKNKTKYNTISFQCQILKQSLTLQMVTNRTKNKKNKYNTIRRNLNVLWSDYHCQTQNQNKMLQIKPKMTKLKERIK